LAGAPAPGTIPAAMSTFFEAELREQPEVLARLLQVGRPRAQDVAARIRERSPRFAVLAARGSSDNAARYGQYLFGIRNGLVAALATPSLFTHYGARPALGDALVIGISQSGQSPDIVEVVREGRRQGALTLAVTNEAASPLAEAAELVMPLEAGTERAVAATKTYTAQLMVLSMLSAAWTDDAQAWTELEALPGQVTATLEANHGTARIAESLREHSRLVVLGRGYNLSTAFEITLKVKETSGVMAHGYSSADFLHGPKAILDRTLPVMVVSPGRAFGDLDGVLALAREQGAPFIAISDRPEILSSADIALPLAAGVPEWLSPLVAVVPGQMWALGFSLARGLQPDAPRGLTKVTHTR
jgi:glutamine---fructose-6-phosphate transaminase (isomerizing)